MEANAQVLSRIFEQRSLAVFLVSFLSTKQK